MGDLLNQAADWFKARKTIVDAWYTDENGRYAFRVTVDGQPFIVGAKKYLDSGNASFMGKKVVQRAIDQEALLLLFVKSDGRRLVFDPRTVDQLGDHGSTARADRKARGEAWIDISIDAAVDFRDWYDHGDQPQPPRRIDTADDAPNRPWDVTAWGDDDA